MSEIKYKLITITDSISPTSMPYNEFVLYRHDHRKEDQQVMIVLFENMISKKVNYPDDLHIFRCGKSMKKLRQAIKSVLLECENKNQQVVFHIHEGKSVLFFHAATGGKYRRQTVYTIHSTFANYPFHNKVFAALASLLSQRVVCVSRASFDHYPAWLKRLLGNRILWVQNGVDCERVNCTIGEEQPQSTALNRKILRLLYTARLIPLKRHELLIRALSNLPYTELSLIGQGEGKKALQDIAKDCGISERLHFLGVLPRDEVYKQIKAHDVYVSSSSYEGLPISVLEAMSCGVVCAVSDIEQHREIQEKCPSLITVKNTVGDWGQAIQKISAMSAEERERIGNQNKMDVDQYFSLARMHAQYGRVYDEVAKGITI